MHSGLSDNVLIKTAFYPRSISGAVQGAVIDTNGWDGCAFILGIGAITDDGTLDARVVRDDNSGMNSNTNVSGAALTQVVAAGNNNVAIIDVFRPRERYLALVATQAANTVLGGAIAVLYRRNGVLPPTQAATQVVKVMDV